MERYGFSSFTKSKSHVHSLEVAGSVSKPLFVCRISVTMEILLRLIRWRFQYDLREAVLTYCTLAEQIGETNDPFAPRSGSLRGRAECVTLIHEYLCQSPLL
ncbi:hypothetical protein TcWFU_002759 [Taenia crassiceps]|uniref:Uncharacterized protein n=1 Tax=Taenia crassiceps TaxID=6207 RepID=A0ABR4QAB3_9CEST